MSTTSAAVTLLNIIDSRLNRKCDDADLNTIGRNCKKSLKTYVCFVDFSKCFDSIDRTLYFEKLQKYGIPYRFCMILKNILQNTKCYIRSGDSLADPFTTTTGLFQGCSLSSIGFSLFASDLPTSLRNVGPSSNGKLINYIQYADDLAIISRTPDELNDQLYRLESYCKQNNLKINTEKTEILIFHKGRLSKFDQANNYEINHQKIKLVKQFKYLGFTFTTQLKFTEHVKNLHTKASKSMGYILSKIKKMDKLSLQSALRLFECYVLPTVAYGIAVWYGKCSKQRMEALNTIFTRFLKRYLGIPYNCSNAITYHVTSTQPLTDQLKISLKNAEISLHRQLMNICEAPKFANEIFESSWSASINLRSIPSFFWMTKVFDGIPKESKQRRKLMFDIYDLSHHKLCQNEDYHRASAESYDEHCTCIQCGNFMEHFHLRYDCNPFKMSPSYDIFQLTSFLGDNFQCLDCKKEYLDKDSFEEHIKIMHTNVKTFTCDDCSNSYTTEQQLNRHKKTVHKKSNEHICVHCPYTTKTSKVLDKHIKTVHKVEKPNTELKTHIRTAHEKPKDFKCEHCMFCTAYKLSLKQHIKTKHE